MHEGGVDAAILVAALGAGPPPPYTGGRREVHGLNSLHIHANERLAQGDNSVRGELPAGRVKRERADLYVTEGRTYAQQPIRNRCVEPTGHTRAANYNNVIRVRAHGGTTLS